MQIRDAVEADLPAIVAIYNTTIPGREATADTAPVSVADRRPWFREHSAAHPLWVMEDEGVVVGWLSLQSFYGRPAYDATVEISLYVLENRRRQGIGRELLRHALEKAPAIGVTTLLAFAFGHNAPSLALFESENFEPWGTLPGVALLDGAPRDLVILGRKT